MGIPEAWLVDLPADAIEAHHGPGPQGYRHVRTLRRGDTLSPLNLPGIVLSVDAILG